MFSNNISKISSLFNKLDETSEFEIMFYNYKQTNKLSIIKFMHVLNYIKYRANTENLKLINTSSLDISYRASDTNTLRISIDGINKINNIVNIIHQRKNHVACSLLASQFNNDDNVKFILKTLDRKTIIDLDQYDIRFRLSSENPMKKTDMETLSNLQYTDADNIIFRFKQRVTLFITENIRIDVTIVKQSNNPNTLTQNTANYEIEIDYSPNKSKLDEKILDLLLKETEKVKQVLEDTDTIISHEESENIIKQYKKISWGFDSHTSLNLYSMKPISAEVQHIVDKIPNKYSVTDKADGEHFIMFVLNENVYFISSNLVVKKTSYKVNNLGSSIFDGELIHLHHEQKYLFMIFDCLHYDGIDIRHETELEKRLEFVNKLMDKMKIKDYRIKKYSDKFNLINQEKHYITEMEHFYSNMNKLINDMNKNDILFHPKMFLFPTGGDNSEVYSFSHLIWTGCTDNAKVGCKYLLDGIIFTGISQKYTSDKKDHKYPIYKYKPPTTNSIDVYLTFQKNVETNTFVDIYDNSIGNTSTNKVFRIVNFFVGDSAGTNNEYPIPFMKEENNHEAFFPLNRGEVRDVEGNLVNDNTVVEIIYVNDTMIPHQYRWKILRTRWDKTETVLRHKKSYGNYKDIAQKVWKSMRECITIEEIAKLARQDSYNSQQKQLSSRIDNKVISSERAQDIYYQKITNLGKTLRQFHNWMKSNLIYTYCGESINHEGRRTRKHVLDLGIGRGGDILKYYHARVAKCVGVEPRFEDLFGSLDSATARYEENKSKYPGFTEFVFIQGDAQLQLVSSIQEKKLTNMTPNNKQLMNNVFDNKKQYDVISIQFAIHYFFDTQQSSDNFINTVKTYLKKDGYLICTLFDSTRVMKQLNGKNIFTSYYTTDDGKRSKFFEIIKLFEGDIKDDVGQKIDVHMDWISEEGIYYTENLLTSKLLINAMKKADCVLVDTDLFMNSHTINKDWITQVTPFEHNPKNKNTYDKIAPFFAELKDADKESKIWNDLFRFYVFKKI
jgi:hypothetical protein